MKPRQVHRARVASYVISLPERVVRSAAALAGGLIREIGDVSVPSAVRRTKTYQMMVDIALRFMIEQVGEVKGVYPSGSELASDFLLRRTAGHGIELAGLLAFRASPVWIMAASGRRSGAGRYIVQEIADALKQEGLLAGDARFENVDQLLEGPRAERQPGGRSVQCSAAGCGGPAPRVGRVSRSGGENSAAQSCRRRDSLASIGKS